MVFLNQFFFGYFPYIAMTIFLLGSAMRYDRDQYTWKSDSSQLLRKQIKQNKCVAKFRGLTDTLIKQASVKQNKHSN
jgi:hypothetical protein